MQFQITTVRQFPASHQLRLYDNSLEELHDHVWQVKVAVGASQLDSIGVVMDFHLLERKLDAVLDPMRHHRLNDLPPFQQTNPSAENVALHIARSLQLPAKVILLSVEVWETSENSAIYRP